MTGKVGVLRSKGIEEATMCIHLAFIWMICDFKAFHPLSVAFPKDHRVVNCNN